MARSKPRIFAYVMPLRPQHIDRIISGKTIIGKFLPRQGAASRFGRKTYILFYETKGNRRIVGQGEILHSQLMMPKDALEKYGSLFFLTQNELERYTKRFPGRENKEMLVIHLTNIEKFEVPIGWQTSPAMTGIYLSRVEYKQRIESRT